MSEAQRVAELLALEHVIAVITSPLRRAVHTGEAIAAAPGARLRRDDRLTDRDYGTWAGRPEAGVAARWGSLAGVPGIEPAGAVTLRARVALEHQRPKLSRRDVVLVWHDAILHALLGDVDRSLAGDTIRLRTGCRTRLSARQDGWTVDVIDAKPDRPSDADRGGDLAHAGTDPA